MNDFDIEKYADKYRQHRNLYYGLRVLDSYLLWAQKSDQPIRGAQKFIAVLHLDHLEDAPAQTVFVAIRSMKTAMTAAGEDWRKIIPLDEPWGSKNATV